MKAINRYGYIKFYPVEQREVYRFENLNDCKLIQRDDYYTFEEMAKTPKYSLQGFDFENLKFIKNWTGDPSEILKENNITFDLNKKEFVLTNQITDLIELNPVNIYYSTNQLPQCFSIDKNEKKLIIGYDAFIDCRNKKILLSNIEYKDLI